MSDGEGSGPAIPRDPCTGRLQRRSARLEPPSVLLGVLRGVARSAVRRVYNDPATTAHVERKVLGWLLKWDPSKDQPVRQYIGLLAGNEARRAKALRPGEREPFFRRSYDGPKLEEPRIRDGTSRDVPNGTS